MTKGFSALQRTEAITALAANEYDLLIIGGGITGAGIALDAQTRGVQTALIEMQDFAAGTSNRSTKLVHGGLRYLKQLEIRLVAEVGKERAIVYENAPHVTEPQWMLLPLIEGGTFGKLATSVGLFVYDYLAGVKRSERRSMLNIEQTLQKEPLLRKDGLKGAGCYVEYRTDDARLTLEVLKEAVHRGTTALTYAKAEHLLYRDGKVIGVKVRDVQTDQTFAVYAKKIVNATGPWVDELREMDGSKKGKYIHHTKGVHIVVDGKRFPLHNPIYFDVPDGRMVFAVPRDGKTYIGTTDTDYHQDLLHPRMTKGDLEYLVNAINFMFPSVRLTPEDVESSWTGVRPLIHEEGKSPSEISRKDEVFLSASGLITIAGGKLTGYRKMAEKVVDIVTADLAAEKGKPYPSCTTDTVRLSGGDFGGSRNFKTFVERKTNDGLQLGLSKEEAEKLSKRYGTNIDVLYDIIRNRKQDLEISGLSLEVFASLIYGIEHEMCLTPSDYFIRRTASMYFDIPWVHQWKAGVIKYMAQIFQWNEGTTQAYTDELEQRIRDVTEAV
ncbi:glycerol-3-phosphate dehydrogenase/oxidase [Fodinisporobacter ferrooxydans]|uniref:Glycerol-3-phosphate dehydrogenase n=1 Tax=Fodinisporobacter ferrooxydans TaxID=2901836 RepID=A0ABY4CS25_9BACL|nr:glycerol-3-phosphate dehydrogenase/oxidase [Alicyclobacillaceae bacterium MYW30-H2]